jgi:hypothetical protein
VVSAQFAGESPFSFIGLDIKSYAMAMLKKIFATSSNQTCRSTGSTTCPHTHKALEDAIEQGALFCNMLAENTRQS